MIWLPLICVITRSQSRFLEPGCHGCVSLFMPMSWIQLAGLGRCTWMVSPTSSPSVLSTWKLIAPTGTYVSVMLCVVPATVCGEPEPETWMSVRWLVPVASSTVPSPELFPEPSSTTPLTWIMS